MDREHRCLPRFLPPLTSFPCGTWADWLKLTHSITEATDVPAYWKQVNQPTYLGRWQRLTTTESFCLTAQRRVCENLSQVMRFVGHLDLSEQMCSLHRFCIGRRKVSSNFIFIFYFLLWCILLWKKINTLGRARFSQLERERPTSLAITMKRQVISLRLLTHRRWDDA